MSADEIARLDRIESLLEKLLRAQAAAAPVVEKASYTPKEFGALVGRSARWVQSRVSIGLIPRVAAGGRRNVLIPASAVESFKTGRARL